MKPPLFLSPFPEYPFMKMNNPLPHDLTIQLTGRIIIMNVYSLLIY
jgi:hypothetical protein